MSAIASLPIPRSRPLTDPEYAALTPEQRIQGGLDEAEPGAPADFNGRVFPNPNHIQPRLDTESAIEPTRLPHGVTFNKGNYTGGAKFDLSNPEAADVIPAMGREIGTQFDKPMSAQPMPWEKYATNAPSSGAGPWAHYGKTEPNATNPPKVPKPASVIPPPEPMFGHIQTTLGNIAVGASKNLWDVSAPGIAASTMKRFYPGVLPPQVEKDTTPLKELGNEAAETFLPMMAGGILEEPAPGARPNPAERPQIARPSATAAAPEESTLISRIGDVAKRRISRIPGVQAVKDFDYVIRGNGAPEAPAPPIPKPPTLEPPIPETNGIQWGTGGHVPLEVRGTRIAPPEPAPESAAGSMVRSVEGESATPNVKPISRVALGRQLDQALPESLGVEPTKPLRPGISLKNQIAAQTTKLPEGFTPVESSVLKGYKYDPATQRLTTITNAGQSYTHAEVTPEEFKAFEDADSPGAQWNKQIRANHVQVEKNGQPTKPILRNAGNPATDLAQQLKDSLPPSQEPVGKPVTNLAQQLKQAAKGGIAKPTAGSAPSSIGQSTIGEPSAEPGSLEDQLNQMSARVKKGESLKSIAESQRDAYPVKITYDEHGIPTSETDGRHRVIQAIERGQERIPVLVDRGNGPIETTVDPKVLAREMGVDKESLAATDEQQSYRQGKLQPRPMKIRK